MTEIAPERQEYFNLLRATILNNIPTGFSEQVDKAGLSYVVPHSIFPAGYHCNPSLALPFISINSKKKFIGFHHMGLYADEDLFAWFVKQYPEYCQHKLDMGKSCVRFNRIEQIPYDLIAQRVTKISVKQ